MISPNTETSELADKTSGGWVFYDGNCSLCTATANRFRYWLGRAGFQLAPLQTPWVRQRLALSENQPLTEMVVLTREGERLGGADAILAIGRQAHVSFIGLAGMPLVRPLLRAVYRWVASRRHCLGSVCQLKKRSRTITWLPLLLLPVIAIVGTRTQPPWVMMWSIAFAIWFGCKWLTLRHARTGASLGRKFGYLLAWPGMDATGFLNGGRVAKPSLRSWINGLVNLLGGAALLWIMPRFYAEASPLVAGWRGLIGLVLLLHFGAFHLLACFWQSWGVAATPIMRSPVASMSLGEFWANRWNVAFNQLARSFVFRPLNPWIGRAGATVAVFLVSGLVHELAISVPARGGYGLPTGYFILQAAAVLFERSALGLRLGLGKGWRGWIFAMTIAALPAFGLFHPIFVQTVILPFMDIIGAL